MRCSILLCLAIILSGCGAKSSTPISNPIAGTWIYRDPKVTEPTPTVLLYSLHVLPDGRYLIGGGMAPLVTGRARLRGDKFTLTPDPYTDAEKASLSSSAPVRPVQTGTLTHGAKAILLNDEKTSVEMKKEPAHKTGPKSVTTAEAPLVGRYPAEVHYEQIPEALQGTVRRIQPFAFLELREDNTFTSMTMGDVHGTWKLDGKKIVAWITDLKLKIEFKVDGDIIVPAEVNGKEGPYYFKKARV